MATVASDQVVQLKDALLVAESDEESDESEDIVLPESIAKAANQAENLIVGWTQNLGSLLSKVVTISPDPDALPAGMILSRQQALLKQVHQNIQTYTTEPLDFIRSQEMYRSLNIDDVAVLYKNFCASWQLSAYTNEISKLFSADEKLRSIHSHLGV